MKLQNVKKGIEKHWKTGVGLMMSAITMVCMAVTSFAADATTPVQFSDFAPVLESLQSQISVSTVVGVVAAVLAACVGLAFMWWGLRKVISSLMGAFKKGTVKA